MISSGAEKLRRNGIAHLKSAAVLFHATPLVIVHNLVLEYGLCQNVPGVAHLYASLCVEHQYLALLPTMVLILQGSR